MGTTTLSRQRPELRSIAIFALCVMAWPLTATPARADTDTDNSGSQLDEVIVTAEKRDSTIQRTPISITALGAAQLGERAALPPLKMSCGRYRVCPSAQAAQDRRNWKFADCHPPVVRHRPWGFIWTMLL